MHSYIDISVIRSGGRPLTAIRLRDSPAMRARERRLLGDHASTLGAVMFSPYPNKLTREMPGGRVAF